MAAVPARASAPLRVVVLGASASVETSYNGGPRADLAYPRVIERTLWAAGHPATVRVHAEPADRTRHGLATWAREVERWAPDVVVVHYGQADNVHLFLPRWLERHANSPRRRPGRVRDAYRKLAVRPVWITLARLQSKVDARVDTSKELRRQRRMVADIERLVAAARAAGQPLVVLPTLLRPGPPWQSWFPGAAARMATTNRLFADVVRRADDPDVRTFPLADLVLAGRPADHEPTPDGGHFTPEVHCLVGEALADVILDWAATAGRPAPTSDEPVRR